MKVCTAVLACCLLFGLAIIPAQAFADEFCQSDPSIYQYQPCGTVRMQICSQLTLSGPAMALSAPFKVTTLILQKPYTPWSGEAANWCTQVILRPQTNS